MRNKGFTLIESLIYIFCLTFFILIFISIANLYINLKSNIYLINSKLEIFIAIDILKDYLLKAPEFRYFKVVEKDNLIYKSSDLDIGFVLSFNNLYKYVGKYENRKWVKKRSSLIAQNIRSIDFKIKKNLLIINILDFKNYSYNFYVLNKLEDLI